jgi:nicotinamidase-related amidase
MKRRTFLAHLARTPILGSAGYLASLETSARGSDVHETAAIFQQTPVAGTSAPIPRIDPLRSALLVMDYQPAWIQTLTDTDVLLSRAAQAIATARDAGMQVAYCRVGFTPADYAAVPAGNVIFSQLASTPGALDEDSPAMAVDARVAPEPGDKVVRKTRVGAFARTDLDAWLRALAIDTLILAGISTSGVVLSTVCDAADRDYRLVVLADACADRDPEIQNVLTHSVFPQRAEVITVADLPEALRPAS